MAEAFDASLTAADFAGQPAAERLLGGSIPHALLITGMPGVGKRSLARLIVRTLLCTGEKKPCGVCPACIQLAAGSNPDVFVLRPGEHISPKARDGSKGISVDDIREAVRLAGEHAYGAGNRVFIIEQAENMNESAQNALLKTLEEPQPGVVFLLLTDMAGMLLSTIRSRCREIQLHLWPDSKVLAVLRAHGVAEATALAAAQAAGGSIGRALAIASDTAWWERRKRLMEDFFGLEKRSDIPLVSADWCEQKGEADALFDDLTGMVQTLMLVRYSRADKAQLADYPEAWQRMAQQGDAAAFVRLLDAISQAAMLRQSQVTWQAILEQLMLQFMEEKSKW